MEINCCCDIAARNQSTLKRGRVIKLRVPDEAVPGTEKCIVNIIGGYLQIVHSPTSVQRDMQFVIRKSPIRKTKNLTVHNILNMQQRSR